MMTNMGVPGFLFFLVYLVVLPICFWMIFSKAGFKGYWGLLSIIPFGALVLLIFLAFADWPKERTT